MIGKNLIFVFIFSASALASPQLTLFAGKSSTLKFIKWLDLKPAVVVLGKPVPQTSVGSKWYMSADYFGKVGNGELKVGLSFRLNDATNYDVAILNKSDGFVADHVEFTTNSDLLNQCSDDKDTTVTVDDIVLVDGSFHAYVTVKCVIATVGFLPDGIRQVANAVGGFVNGLKDMAANRDKPVAAEPQNSDKQTPNKKENPQTPAPKKKESPQKPVPKEQNSEDERNKNLDKGLENMVNFFGNNKDTFKNMFGKKEEDPNKKVQKGLEDLVKMFGNGQDGSKNPAGLKDDELLKLFGNGEVDLAKLLQDHKEDFKNLLSGDVDIAKLALNNKEGLKLLWQAMKDEAERKKKAGGAGLVKQEVAESSKEVSDNFDVDMRGQRRDGVEDMMEQLQKDDFAPVNKDHFAKFNVDPFKPVPDIRIQPFMADQKNVFPNAQGAFENAKNDFHQMNDDIFADKAGMFGGFNQKRKRILL